MKRQRSWRGRGWTEDGEAGEAHAPGGDDPPRARGWTEDDEAYARAVETFGGDDDYVRALASPERSPLKPAFAQRAPRVVGAARGMRPGDADAEGDDAPRGRAWLASATRRVSTALLSRVRGSRSPPPPGARGAAAVGATAVGATAVGATAGDATAGGCLLYTSPSPRD